MSFLLRIKHGFGRLLPAKKIESKRVKKGRSLNDNVKVAILFENKDEAYLKKNKKFLQHLKGEYGVREAFILVYVDELNKDLPVYLNHLKELDYFTREDLNWRLKPNAVLSGFCKKEYDILIDLTTEKCDAMEHVVAGSTSHMKVGRRGAVHEQYMDLLIDLSSTETEEEYLKQVEYYLSKLSFN